MPTSTSLPGLDRLIAICQQHSLPCELYPPLASAPELKEFIPGEPLDPQLADVYQRTGGAELGTLSIYRPDLEGDGLVPWNINLRQGGWMKPFLASLVFAVKTGFSYYLATVPRLADSRGVQPVVHVDGYEGHAVPVASSVDRFFDTYSRYLELMVVDPEYIYSKVAEVTFPWGVTQLIAHDEPLMELIRAGRFDFLTRDDEEGHQWTQRLPSARLD